VVEELTWADAAQAADSYWLCNDRTSAAMRRLIDTVRERYEWLREQQSVFASEG
jgi:hypothetical protein